MPDFGHRVAFYANRAERSAQLLQQPDVITTSIEEVSSNAKPLIRQIQKFPKRLKKLVAMLPHQEVCDPAPYINFLLDSFDLNPTVYSSCQQLISMFEFPR